MISDVETLVFVALAQAADDVPQVPAVMQWLLGVWLLVLGGCVGSFMNVVIYRLPAGLSIVHPRSRCPKCERPIRGYDNIPVLSWLLLGGRCRDCRAAISARYPAVEALVAGIFFSLAVVEVFSGGTNLPLAVTITESSASRHSESLLWVLYASHAVLLCTLICASLIEYDGKPVPRRLFAPAFVMSGFVWLVWPELWPPPTNLDGAMAGAAPGFVEGILGLAVGSLLGLLTYPLTVRGPAGKFGPITAGILAALCGLTFGWPLAAAVPVSATIALLVVGLATRLLNTFSRIPWSAYLTLAAGLCMMNWRTLVERLTWLGQDAGWATLGGAVAVVFLLSLASARIVPAAAGQLPPAEGRQKRKQDERRSKRDGR
jgi:prepilin signal peptidase PulO-like enzyme (type II secretory pathway)